MGRGLRNQKLLRLERGHLIQPSYFINKEIETGRFRDSLMVTELVPSTHRNENVSCNAPSSMLYSSPAGVTSTLVVSTPAPLV